MWNWVLLSNLRVRICRLVNWHDYTSSLFDFRFPKIIYKIISKINFQSTFKSLRKKPFFAFSTSSISKTFREGVVVNFQLRNFFVLIGSHGDKLSLFIDVCSEGRQRNPWYIRTSHDVKSGLIFVHRIQDRLNYIVSINESGGFCLYF